MPQDVELAACDVERLLLEGIGPIGRHEEPDEVPGRTDRELSKLHPADRPVLGDGPLAKGQLPGKVEQLGGATAEAKPRERGRWVWRRQSFFRKYAAIDAS